MEGVNGYVAIDQTDEALRESESKYHFLYKAMAQGVVYQNTDGHIISANPAAERILGLTLDQMQGRTSIDPRWRAIREDGSDFPGEEHPAMLALCSGQEVRNVVMGVFNPLNEAYTWIKVDAVPQFMPGADSPFQVFTTFDDITERKELEDRIRELNAELEKKIERRTAQLAQTNNNLQKEIEERQQIEAELRLRSSELQHFFEFAFDLLCIADQSGKLLRVNKSWERVLGYPVHELENQRFLDFLHPDDVAPTLAEMSRADEDQYTNNFINRYRAKDGSYRHIEWRGMPVGDKLYAVAQDITERLRADAFEQELLKFSPQLAGLYSSEIDYALHSALGRMGTYLSADRAYIFLFDDVAGTMSNTHEWCSETTEPAIDELQSLPLEIFPQWMKKLRNHENIVIDAVEDLPDSWQAERDILEPQGVQSLVVMPLLVNNQLFGFVGIDSVAEKRKYTKGEINVLTVWGSMLASLITKQRSDAMVERVRKNYQNFFNTLDDFIFVFDEQGTIITANEVALSRLGYTRGEVINASGTILRPQVRLEEATQTLQDILAGRANVCTIPLVTKSGQQIPVETKLKRGTWNGQPVILGVSKDITPIKLSEEKFAAAFQRNAAMMSICSFDEGRYIDANNAFTEMMGFTRDELIGNTNKELCIYENDELRKGIIAKIENGIPIRKLEVQMHTKNGEIKTGLLSTDSIYIGERRCLLTVIIDITDRKNAEEESRKARLEAEQANLAKSEFLSRMSHELRTPMNSILGFAQLLEMGDLNPGQKKGVGHILRSGKHLLSLINDVLDIARIESGHLSLSLAPVKLSEAITEMMDTIQPQAISKQVDVLLRSSETNQLAVEADPQLLRQVLLNLLNNAIKYNRAGGSVQITTEMSTKGVIRVLVSDTGIGIPQESMDKLFRPFERIGAEQSGAEGTGLGLAVVKKLIQAMEGTVGVNSTPGEGSTFWFELPQSAQQPETATMTGDAASVELKHPVETRSILYIEDNASNIELVEQIVANQRPGIRLLTETQGSRALDLAIQHAPALILLDLNLPDLNGKQVLEQLQQHELTRKIPVIIISADAVPQQVERLLQAGAQHYLTKPLDISSFLHAIDHCIFA